MHEELIIHQISTAGKHTTENSFEQSQQEIIAALHPDTLFWKQYTRPVETLLWRKIEKDLAWQGKVWAISGKTLENSYTPEPIAVNKLREDFTLFKSSLQEAHPSLYR